MREVRKAKLFHEIMKFNPYHGKDGRFTTSGSAASFTYAPGKSRAHDMAIAREKERQSAISSGSASEKNVPKENQEQIDRVKKFEEDLIAELQRNIRPEYRHEFNTIHDLLNDDGMERDIKRVKTSVENNDKSEMNRLKDEFTKTSEDYARPWYDEDLGYYRSGYKWESEFYKKLADLCESKTVSKSFSDLMKFNPYHDRLGRFTTPGSAASFTYKPGQGKMYDNAIAREKERMASMGAGAKEEGFRPAKSREEAYEYATKVLNIRDPNYGNAVDLETINHINQEITEIQKKYPVLRDAVTSIRKYDNPRAYAAAATDRSGTNELYIGQTLYGKGIQSLKKSYQSDVDSGFHPENTDYRSIIWHEYGHIYANLHYKLEMGYEAKSVLGFSDGLEYRDRVTGRSYEKAAVRNAAKSLRISQKELKRRISRYAEKEPAETFAEAFAEFNCSPNPRPECIAIMKAAGIIK